MNPAKPISMLAIKSNIALMEKCMEDARRQSSNVFQSGKLVRMMHTDGCKNYSKPSSFDKSLLAGKTFIDGISHHQPTKSKVRFFGQNIANAMDILTRK